MQNSSPLLSALQQNLPPGSRLLLAISGGVDSMALLHAALSLKGEMEFQLEVAHLDHGIRDESAEQAQLLQRRVSGYGLPFYLKRVEPQAGENLEAWGRRERYQFFGELLAAKNLDWAVTAHTATDVAETLLMRLLSNKEPRSIFAVDGQRKLLRPMLKVSREQVVDYCKTQSVEWIEDPSNADERFLRNRVRNVLMPKLREHFHEGIEALLANRAECFAEDIEGMTELVRRHTSGLANHEWGSPGWMKEVQRVLGQLPEQMHWRVAGELLDKKIGYRLGRHKAREVLEVLCAGQVAAQLPGGFTLRRSKGKGVSLSSE